MRKGAYLPVIELAEPCACHRSRRQRRQFITKRRCTRWHWRSGGREVFARATKISICRRPLDLRQFRSGVSGLLPAATAGLIGPTKCMAGPESRPRSHSCIMVETNREPRPCAKPPPNHHPRRNRRTTMIRHGARRSLRASASIRAPESRPSGTSRSPNRSASGRHW